MDKRYRSRGVKLLVDDLVRLFLNAGVHASQELFDYMKISFWVEDPHVWVYQNGTEIGFNDFVTQIFSVHAAEQWRCELLKQIEQQKGVTGCQKVNEN